MKKIVSVLLSLVMVLTAAFALPSSAYASGISVRCSTTIYTHNKTKLKIRIGTKSVSASKCRISTSNKAVATVSKSGYVKGIKAGTVKITVKLKSNAKKKVSIKIRVKTNGIVTPRDVIPFAKGCSNKLVIYVKGKRAGGGTVSFSSSKKSVAAVDKNGMVDARKAGTAIIKVKLKSNAKMYRNIKIVVKDIKSFVISAGSAPLNGEFLNYGTYNKYSNDYYAMRSYMEYFETHSGGTLTLRKGTFSLCNAIYIPSNTILKLSDGTTIKKTAKTGSSNEPAGTCFMFVAPSKAMVKGAYSKYNGVHDSKIMGTGKAVIDMKNGPKDRIGNTIVMGHNKNISIFGITFTNLEYGHFIEMDASSDVIVKECVFQTQVHEEYNSSSECINLDTPDRQTDGFHQTWTSYDKTPNKNVIISYCKFYNVQRGVGTHQYSAGKYHANIQIKNCTFTKCFNGGIGVMNWKNSKIMNNTFSGIGKDTDGTVLNTEFITHVRGIFVAGSSGITINNNSFRSLYECIRLFPKENKGYPISYNSISRDEVRAYADNNTYRGGYVDEPYVKVYSGTLNGQSTDFAYKYKLKKG